MITLVCAIQKGGQGKSMLATHLAFLAAEQGKSVLAVDLDGQGNFSRNLDAEYDSNAAPSHGLFFDKVLVPDAVKLPFKVKGSIAVMTGDQRLVEIDETPKVEAQRLRLGLAKYSGFDFCVIDPPPTLGKRLRAALMAADFVVMPFAPARESVDGLGDLMDTIQHIKHSHNPDLHVLGLLPNKVNPRSKAEAKIIADIASAAPGMLMPMRIQERTSISSAMAASRPVWKHSGGESNRRASTEVRAACSAILKTVFKK